jgi:urease accessory protein
MPTITTTGMITTMPTITATCMITGTTTTTTRTTILIPIRMTEAEARLTLLQWLSPAFPVSGFAYSHGLETAVADGRIASALDLEAWLDALLMRGSGRADAILLARVLAGDAPEDLAEIAAALAASRERWDETAAMGRAFLDTTAALGAAPSAPLPYPVAFGLRARALGLPAAEVIGAFLHAFAANLTAVAVRFVPLGQTEGQAVLARLAPRLARLAGDLAGAGLDDLSSATFHADLAAMQHETLQPRLFKT